MLASVHVLLGARLQVGRTSLAVALADALGRRGRETLLIDLDPEAHATLALLEDDQRVTSEEGNAGQILRSWLQNRTPPPLDRLLNPLKLHPELKNPFLTLLPGSVALGELARQLPGRKPGPGWLDDPASALTSALRPARERFHAIVVDVPVGLDLLVMNALVHATDLLWVDVPDRLWLHGVRAAREELSRFLENRSLKPRQHGILASRWRQTPEEASRLIKAELSADPPLAPIRLRELAPSPPGAFTAAPQSWRAPELRAEVARLLRWMDTGRVPEEPSRART